MRKCDVLESTKISYYELICNMFGFEIILEFKLNLIVMISFMQHIIVQVHP